MKRYLSLIFIVSIPTFIGVEDILVKAKKPKTESVSKIKEQIACDLEQLLSSTTRSIRHLTALIDDIVSDVQQLAGQESGPLACADKKTLETFRQKVCHAKDVLNTVETHCCLR